MRPRVNKQIQFYSKVDKDKISKMQLKKFNELWQHIQENVPFYKNLVTRNDVPQNINNWEDFKKLPIIDRFFASSNIKNLTDKSKKHDLLVTTGGSTGTPLKYPSWKTESRDYEVNVWFARNFYNISRSDRMFRIWGHSHLLGSGLSKYKKMLAFKVGLPLIGYKRFSAYDLSDEKLRIAGDEIIRFKPNYIIGYSKALQMLAQINKDRRDDFHNLKLKAVIGAAEGFEKEDDKYFISEIFGCPVGLEYASMETKILAHTHPEGGYRVLWRHNLVECVDEEDNPSENGRILVTSLYPRAFPLIRYELGDLISGAHKNVNSVYSFDNVAGRNNDFLMLDENTPIHSESITHAIKFSNKITAYQIRYTRDLKYTIYVKANSIMNENDIKEIKRRLDRIDKRLTNIEIKQVDSLKQTIAGKTKWLIEE
ncbi:phenylacetate--CoA ligase family protein [Pallidibacillus thermolactis]|uniref:hypothetical protein n=1 Tax=Pallidibacillus thermolactis TaxID=251051 RepID=UPI0021DA99E9|nr:hypothetical protein [Pallidibacillus thermolactis]MCU9599710.1 hypothetical protein [Pallidibacillus thermolactis subsp. kokeshiiformis]